MLNQPQGALAQAAMQPDPSGQAQPPEEEIQDASTDSPAYQSALNEAKTRLYENGAAEGLAQALQSAPDVATGIAEQAQQLLEATDEVTDSSVPDEIYMMLGIELMGEVADIAEAAGLPVTSADLASAVRMFLGSVIESLGGDPSQIRDAMSKLDPALVGSEAEAQPFGGQ